VINTGPFMPAEAVGRLLQPFQRRGPGRIGHGEGLGLVLSIVSVKVKRQVEPYTRWLFDEPIG